MPNDVTFILLLFPSQSVVQVETLGEFGVFFILFAVGLEFSPDRIKKVMIVCNTSFSLAKFACTLA